MNTFTRVIRTVSTQGMTDQERDALVKELAEECENERIRQQIAPSLQAIDEMMKQITNKKG